MQTYVVKQGDTLPGLAMRFYGDPTQWPRILIANPSIGDNPRRLHVGKVLNVPTDADCVRQQSTTSPQEQLQGMDKGSSYRLESEALGLLVTTTALLRDLRESEVRPFSKKAAARNPRAIGRSTAGPRTGTKGSANRPLPGETRGPRKTAAANAGQLQHQGAEIGRIYRELIQTGKWPPKGKRLGSFQMRTLHPRLLGARQEYFRALGEHLA
jgi:hypothetical protein